MADEIRINAAIQADNGTFKVPKEGAAVQLIDQNAAGGGGPGVVNVPAADTIILLPNLTVLGWIRIENIDASNFIDIGPTDTTAVIQPLIRLKPGEACVFRLTPGIVLRGEANTAAVDIKITALED